MSIKRRQAYIALTITAIIWGCAFPIIKPALSHITATQYLYLRFLIASIFSLPIFIYFYIKLKPKVSYLLKVLLIEVGGTALPLLLLYEGLSRTTSLEASLIGATGPIFIVLGGIWFLNERQSKREWQGLALSVLGSFILIAEPLITGKNDATSSSTIGNLLVMGYNGIYTVYVLIAKKIYKTNPPLYIGSLTYAVTAGLYALLLGDATPTLSYLSVPSVLFAVAYMAIPGSILCFGLYLYAMSKIEASEANLFTYLNGVIALPAAYFLLGEIPSLLTLFAVAVIAYGVYRAEIKM